MIADDEVEFNPFTDDELDAMDDATRNMAMGAARSWWAAEQKRHRKAEKRLMDIGAKHERRKGGERHEN